MKRSELFSKLQDIASAYGESRGRGHSTELARQKVKDSGLLNHGPGCLLREEFETACSGVVFSLALGRGGIDLNISLEKAAEALENLQKVGT